MRQTPPRSQTNTKKKKRKVRERASFVDSTTRTKHPLVLNLKILKNRITLRITTKKQHRSSDHKRASQQSQCKKTVTPNAGKREKFFLNRYQKKKIFIIILPTV